MMKKRKWRTRANIFVESGDYIFWKAHGCNYLLSNYEQGIWTPIFPEIYENKVINEEDKMAERVGKKYWEGGSVSQEAIPALMWLIFTPSQLWKMVRQVKRGIPVSHLRKPHNVKIWKSFDLIKENLRGDQDA